MRMLFLWLCAITFQLWPLHGFCMESDARPTVYALKKNALSLNVMASERLTYTLVKEEDIQEIHGLLCKEKVNAPLFRGVPKRSQTLKGFIQLSVRYNNDFICQSFRLDSKANTATAKIPLPSRLMWRVGKREDNAMVGILLLDWCAKAKGSFPSGEDQDKFYANDVKKNIYINMAYAVDPIHQRQGFATEMSVTVMKKFFNDTTANFFIHTCLPDNMGSAKSAEKCGFEKKGQVPNGKNPPLNFSIMSRDRFFERFPNLQGELRVKKSSPSTLKPKKNLVYHIATNREERLLSSARGTPGAYTATYYPKGQPVMMDGIGQIPHPLEPFMGVLKSIFPDGDEMEGSAFLVGPCHLLTTATNLYGCDKWANDVTFFTNTKDGEPCPVKATQLITFKDYLGSHFDYNVGMVILEKPVGDTIGWSGLFPPSTEQLIPMEFDVLGYAPLYGDGLDCARGKLEKIDAENVEYGVWSTDGKCGGSVCAHLPDIGWTTIGVIPDDLNRGREGDYPQKYVGARLTPEKFARIIEWMGKTGHEPKIYQFNS